MLCLAEHSHTSRLKAVPGLQGPAKLPHKPAPASAAFKQLFSNHSFSQSATHMGERRRNSSIVVLPSRRSANPVLKRSQSVRLSRDSTAGGGSSKMRLTTPATRLINLRYLRYCAASSAE